MTAHVWEPCHRWPNPGEPGLFRIACSCGDWTTTGTAEEIGLASLQHDDSPGRWHVVSVRERRVEGAEG